MQSFSVRKLSSIFFCVFVVFSFMAAYGVHSMHPYDADPDVRALGKKDAENNMSEGELTGEALRDKILADPDSAKKGEIRFAQTCSAYCHGDKGSGTEAPLQCQAEFTPDYLFSIIAEGRRSGSRVMPSWKDSISEADRWELVAFIMTLNDLPHCQE